ncbi:MAG TPA: hypothetical protein VFU05_17235 [Cyclobacteriaceae bacterium]|nr:hypothetical protein [Cyclobacteriaceae bacterium]
MELRDFIVTPLILMIVYACAYVLRPSITDSIIRKYFFPALTLKIIGALAVGFVYQFYYHGGDTFNFHTHGSRIIWEAFWDSPIKWFRLLMNDQNLQGIYPYVTRISFYGDPASFEIVRLSALLDMFTFSSYSATAVLFAVISFIGSWMFFLVLYEQRPILHRWTAIASFFIPSVFFWGSGILKDTITLSCAAIVLYSTFYLFIKRKFSVLNVVLLFLGFYFLYKIKIYILLILLPGIIVWVFLSVLDSIRSKVAKILVSPAVFGLAGFLAVTAFVKAGEDNPKYSLGKISETAKVTAYDIRYWTGRDAGSGYTLGELDGSFESMFRLAPDAIVVSLFRPYLWEVSNPLMLLSAIESLILLLSVVFILFKGNIRLFSAIWKPDTFFYLLFSLTFAFAVGVSTYNFGTLVRYKIPMLPFFVMALVLINDQLNNFKKSSVLEATE